MKKKIFALLMSVALVITMAFPIMGAGGDQTGDDIFGMNVYINTAAKEGAYSIGDAFSFTVIAYVGDLYEKIATPNVSITGPEAVTNFQFKNDDGEWKSVEEFNVETTIYNETGRQFQVEFNAVGTYIIDYKYVDANGNVQGQVATKYVTITETSYSVSSEEPTTPEPVTTTIEETTEAPTDAPTDVPTDAPTDIPTEEPTDAPTVEPTDAPTVEPTDAPTDAPTDVPTDVPTDAPTDVTTEAPTTEVPTTVAPTTEVPTTVAPTTEVPTTVAPTTEVPTTVAPTTTAKKDVKAPAKVNIKKVNAKKKSAKKIKLSLKKIKGVAGYQVAIYKSKKTAKKNKSAIIKKYVTKTNVTIKSKKLKNKKKLFVRVRAYVLDAKGKKVFGKWSKIKKVKIKKVKSTK